VVNSVHAIATGAIGGAAKWIENALANLIPIVIAFLARLIGLGGISKKIRDFITKVQTKVRAAVIGWLKKAWAYVKKLFGGGGGKKKKDEKGGRHLKVELPLTMHHEGHTIYAEFKDNKLSIKMASGRLGVLKSLAANAIHKEEKGAKRPKLLKRLEKVYSKLSTIESDLHLSVINSDSEAEGKLLKSIEDVANNLKSIGGEFGIDDLINMGHASKYVEGNRLKPPYDKKVRDTFYPSGYRTATETWFQNRLKTLENPANKSQFKDEMTNNWEPKSTATIDHKTRVVEHWRSHGGNDCNQGDRADFYNETGTMQVVARKNNSSDGAMARKAGLTYTPEVGQKFRGPDE
jgi:hypothetical protein